MTTVVASRADIAEYALRLGDDSLILAQRLSAWSARAPELEEDVALTNIALDLLGQARILLTLAGQHRGRDETEDDLAFMRDERSFLNLRIAELDNGDFARTMTRQLLFASYQLALYEQLQHSADPDLAALAGKAVKEVAYHRDHAVTWTLRLGDGTDESHRRMQAALTELWPYAEEFFESDDLTRRLVDAGAAADPAVMRTRWQELVPGVLEEATLSVPTGRMHHPTGGRRGQHGEVLGHLLAEMQWLHRSHPGAAW